MMVGPMLLDNLAIIDVETTGGSPVRDRIIEIGILRIKDGQLVETFESLVNPERSIPPEITMLTGIYTSQLEDAPTFYSLKDRISDLLQGCVFVAHNARFDYSFIKEEFKRTEQSYTSKVLCTAKLSRRLFPKFRHHNLDSIMERFSISCDIRHRALSDAKVLWDFLQKIQDATKPTRLETVVKEVTKSLSLPPGISKDVIESIPESPGVYIFYNDKGSPLYIGKSINLKDRVLSHFAMAATVGREAKVFQSIASIEVKQTDGELGALLQESELIKRYKPLYNRQLRDVERLIIVTRKQNDKGYFTIATEEVSYLDPSRIDSILAVFRTHGQAKKQLMAIAKEHKLCKKLLALESATKACFGFQIDQCNGACIEKEIPARYNLRFIEAFQKTKVKQWPFKGPIAVIEGNTTHVISHWCYMGELNGEGSVDIDQLHSEEYVFDYDNYKILSRYLLHHTSKVRIQLLKN